VPSVRPGEKTLPTAPGAHTYIKSYHAHFCLDGDSDQKAALLPSWSVERLHVELGDWSLESRGPQVTPSLDFGFTNNLLPMILHWLPLNSLGLTILLHPNTADPRADHLYYALWVDRSQPVNAYDLPRLANPRWSRSTRTPCRRSREVCRRPGRCGIARDGVLLRAAARADRGSVAVVLSRSLETREFTSLLRRSKVTYSFARPRWSLHSSRGRAGISS
jgi:aromatic ring-cleaving dioxygenase